MALGPAFAPRQRTMTSNERAWWAVAGLGSWLLVWGGAGGGGSHLEAAGAPATPVNLTATVAGTTVSLAWQAGGTVTAGQVYWLQVGSAPGAANLGTFPTTATTVVAPGVPDGQYWLRVFAANPAGVSGPSNEAVARVGCGAALVPPQGLTATANGAAVVISWQPLAGASAYLLEAGSAPGRSDLATVPTAATTLAGAVPDGTYHLRVRAVSACGQGEASAEVVLRVGPPLPVLPIFGAVDPAVLGTCSAATHDLWVVDGGDGFRYRTWHPQVDPSGCIYGHEHGDDPALSTSAEVSASPVRFGYIGRRIDHEEAHAGFKVFIANPGDVNDEGRVNRVWSRSVFHMGTGGPKRFAMPHHSAEIRLVHPGFGLAAFTQLMMDTGGVGAVCDPRAAAPVKDVMQLGSPCQLASAYEIWSTTQSVRYQGRVVYTAFATPAVFDPITVLNPANPTEVVYAWDPRVAAIKQFTDDWSGHRGCQRESYAQPGYWHNAGGPTTFYTDALGQEVAATDPRALVQQVTAVESVGAPATNDGLAQFKMRRDYCQQRARLSLKN
ncbi:MAG: fibronectin type III domain-containing protein [Acidobacteria bacterium]|nr:fibronectin type III domain-containing protein [Acidobacteriota bacterium]